LQFKKETEISIRQKSCHAHWKVNKLRTTYVLEFRQEAQMPSFFIKASVQNREIVAADIISLQYNTKHEQNDQCQLNLAA
jgi:hypothetical protein